MKTLCSTGLPGGTRSGSVDPSLVFHLYENASEAADTTEKSGISITDAERRLNKDSGFLALAGTTDYGEIVKKAGEGSEQHQLAVKVFENRILVRHRAPRLRPVMNASAALFGCLPLPPRQ
jgi:acetate kinase